MNDYIANVNYRFGIKNTFYTFLHLLNYQKYMQCMNKLQYILYQYFVVK